jgi:hypothetical protein
MRLQEKRLCLLAGLLTGLAVWTKDEGWFFSIWMFLTMAAVAWRSRRLEASFKTGMFLFFLLGWAAPALCSLYLKTCLGTTGGQYAGSGRSLSDFLFLLFGSPKKTQIIAAVFLLFAVDYKQWNGLWILFTAAAILGGRRGFSAYRAVYFALVLLMWSGYFVILHITPLDLRFQIETALLRIMSHASGLAVIFMMEAFARENQP